LQIEVLRIIPAAEWWERELFLGIKVDTCTIDWHNVKDFGLLECSTAMRVQEKAENRNL